MNTNTPYNASGAESPPASPNIREEASAPSPSTVHAPSPTVHAPPPTEANGNNSSAANIFPVAHNKATVAPRALSKDESIELRNLLKATLKINARMSIATEEQDEEDAILLLDYAMDLVKDGKSVGHIAGEVSARDIESVPCYKSVSLLISLFCICLLYPPPIPTSV